jgi:putative chitinase
MTDWAKVIKAVSPRAKAVIVDGLALAMPRLIDEFDLSSDLRVAHFLAQCAHESDGFVTTVEYASGDAYDTRTDLGNTKAKDGDGRLYKGYGIIQNTGKTNQLAAAKALGIVKEWQQNPRILSTFPYAALSAGIFWKSRNLNALADRDDIQAITKKVNGGLNGFASRKQFLARAKKALADLGDGDLGLPAPMPRSKIKSLQEQLLALGYHELGAADGQIGTKSHAAIAAFQADNEIQITGEFDQETQDALFTAPQRSIPDSRANGTPVDSRINKNASTLKKGGLAAGAVGFAGPALNTVKEVAGDPFQALEGVNHHLMYVRELFEPLQALGGFVMDNKMFLFAAAGLGVWSLAKKIETARTEDYRTGKTA